MTATIIPFPARRPSTPAVDLTSVEDHFRDFCHRMGYYGPEDFEPGQAAEKAGRRPLPSRGFLVFRVQLRAHIRRHKRMRDEGV